MRKSRIGILFCIFLAIICMNMPIMVQAEAEEEITSTEKCGLFEEVYEVSYDFFEQEEEYSERIAISEAEATYWKSFGTDYYYNQLSSAEKLIWDELEEACLYYIASTENVKPFSGENVYMVTASIPMGLMDISDAADVVWTFKYSNPQYYFLKSAITYSYDSSNLIIGLRVYDSFASGSARALATNQFRNTLDVWIDEVEQGKYDEEKVKIAHDIVVLNTEYSTNEYDQSAYSMVCLGETVCAGYAATLQLLLNPLGIETIEVTGSNHGWNYVNIHNNWYAVDATWDDGTGSDIYYEYYNKSQYSLQSGNSSHIIEDRWKEYVPEAKYDSTMSNYFQYYSSYFMDDDYVYFTVNDNTTLAERTAMIVDSLNILETTEVPVSVNNLGKEYGVLVSNVVNVRNFVKRLYVVALGRNADINGLTFWSDELINGNRNGAAVAKGFILSKEMESKNLTNEEFVVKLYQTFFNRTPKDGDSGKAFWINLLENGVSRAYVFRGFCHSNEFEAICDDYEIERGNISLTENRDKNHNVTMYVYRCYNRTLGRNPDIKGLNYWTGQINNSERTPVDVAANFVFSKEFIGKNLSDEAYVKVLYNMFFDREADEKGFTFWMEEITSGRRDRYKVFRQFANSAEFKAVLSTFSLN